MFRAKYIDNKSKGSPINPFGDQSSNRRCRYELNSWHVECWRITKAMRRYRDKDAMNMIEKGMAWIRDNASFGMEYFERN